MPLRSQLTRDMPCTPLSITLLIFHWRDRQDENFKALQPLSLPCMYNKLI